MHSRSSLLLGSLALLASLSVGPACVSSGKKPASAPRDAAAPLPAQWTRAFQAEAVLVADEIRIEGPADLLEHVALRQDPETMSYSTHTTSDGLLQELVSKPEYGVEVHVQLDGWALAAFKRVTVLQRPGEVPVTVRALGNAVWIAADGSGERRENSLVFQGVRGP